MSKPITQAEGRRLRRQVKALQAARITQRNEWRSDWKADWISIDYIELTPISVARLQTARKLGHALILVPESGNFVQIFAERLQP